jgi:NADPH:quinone reductase-like Zn-dependent oxidoreductase
LGAKRRRDEPIARNGFFDGCGGGEEKRGVINGIRLQEIGGLIDIGKLRAIVENESPLNAAAKAQELSEAGSRPWKNHSDVTR